MGKFIYVTKSSDVAQEARGAVEKVLSAVEADIPGTIVVAIGGDGTMLQAIREHYDQDVHFVGISAGSLGLLETVEVEKVADLARAFKNRSYSLIEAPLLAASFCQPVGDNAADDRQGDPIGYGFNEISVERGGALAAKFHLKIDASSGNFIGDGVIFSTPLGSTAYNLAAGGPVVDSKLQTIFVATPNNPHFSSHYSSLQRPHVLAQKRKVRIMPDKDDTSNRPLKVIIDGHIVIERLKKPINIFLSDRVVKVIQLGNQDLQNRIEAKRLGRL